MVGVKPDSPRRSAASRGEKLDIWARMSPQRWAPAKSAEISGCWNGGKSLPARVPGWVQEPGALHSGEHRADVVVARGLNRDEAIHQCGIEDRAGSRVIGDFEKVLTIGLGLRHAASVHVFTLTAPNRVVIDVNH